MSISESSLAFFLRRLRHPHLVDWNDAAVTTVLCLVKPSKVAELAYYRFRTRGYLERRDPGVFVYILYLAAVLALMYGLALDYDRKPVALGFRNLIVFVLTHVILPSVVLVICLILCAAGLQIFFRRVARNKLDSRRGNRLQIPHVIEMSQEAMAYTIVSSLNLTGLDSDEEAGRDQGQSTTDERSPTWMYCFDMVCNAAIPAITIAGVTQYIFLPLILRSSDPSFFSQFSAAFFANFHHGAAAVAFVYPIALGSAILPASMCRGAVLLFIPLILWLIFLSVLTLCRVNMTLLCLNLVYGYALPPSDAA